MTSQAYGQFCGLSRALEVVGEPWALLIVRDLVLAPKSFTDLREGLPRISKSVLTARLDELEHAGVVRRRVASGLEGSILYELTEYGSELEDVVLALGRWGSKTLGGPRREEIVTVDSMLMALRATFRPEAARGLRVSYVLELGEIIIHACISDGTLEVGEGSLPDADLIIEAGPALKAVMAGEMSPREAIESGGIRLKTGKVSFTDDPGLLTWFAEIFHVPPAPPTLSRDTRLPSRIGAGDRPRSGDPVPVGVAL